MHERKNDKRRKVTSQGDGEKSAGEFKWQVCWRVRQNGFLVSTFQGLNINFIVFRVDA